jgi:hypothetical protein
MENATAIFAPHSPIVTISFHLNQSLVVEHLRAAELYSPSTAACHHFEKAALGDLLNF